LAIQEVQEQRLEDVDRLRHQMLIYGAGSTNVFIGAYASFVGREGQAIPFGEFLRKVAPYSSESALAWIPMEDEKPNGFSVQHG